MAPRPDYGEALYSASTVLIQGNPVSVTTTSYPAASLPVALLVGPLGMSCTPAEAIDLGNALIAAGHHWQAELAAYQQRQTTQGAAAEGGAA